ncbi:carbon-nitrogen hydrolase family protein [Balneolaceae bacterium YR4-1]|uniref:Carbon-nitrogen hydrolase family protein n=1 Tax=Halalkalibaculum roseum TaxID=2709311 RepID=A0A6M1SWV7_9BACT|nr:carbon-nitrogen hydrolase family protein [Halalkalibaculum roseum]NGP76486.1 carbon-nitrogen hydrolase family protein [Halalkalibaculum roseum]
MKEYTVAAVQMNSQPDLDLNLEQAYGFIKEAAGKEATLVALPENFAFLGKLDARLEESEKISVQAEKFLADTAREFGIYLLGGSYPVLSASGKVFNRSTLISPDGSTLASYDKIHLFDVDLEGGESYRESDYVQPGENEPVTYKSEDLGIIGLSVCYDLRFPELYRVLSKNGAELLAVPSAFTRTTGKDHWHPLLRSRAIENTCYVVAPAQTGLHGKSRKTYGHSLVIDPWGSVLADAGEDTGIIYGRCDPKHLEEVRRSIPSLKHRQL